MEGSTKYFRASESQQERPQQKVLEPQGETMMPAVLNSGLGEAS